MLDPYVRPLIDPPLNHIGKKVASWGISANTLTVMGFICGLTAMVMIVFHYYAIAASLICLNRLLDGLDGAVARKTGLTDFGGFLDIVCDFIIYSGIIFAFGLAESENLWAASFLIFSFIGPITSFLAYAIIAAKKQVQSTRRGVKSFYHLGGICEGTETAFVLIFICLFPQFFEITCVVYGLLCWLTTIGRVYNAWIDFGPIKLEAVNDSDENVYTKPEARIKSQDQ